MAMVVEMRGSLEATPSEKPGPPVHRTPHLPPPLRLPHQSHPPSLCTDSPSSSPSSPSAPPPTIQIFNTTPNPKRSSASPALDSSRISSLTMPSTRSGWGTSSAFACWICIAESRAGRKILSMRRSFDVGVRVGDQSEWSVSFVYR